MHMVPTVGHTVPLTFHRLLEALMRWTTHPVVVVEQKSGLVVRVRPNQHTIACLHLHRLVAKFHHRQVRIGLSLARSNPFGSHRIAECLLLMWMDSTPRAAEGTVVDHHKLRHRTADLQCAPRAWWTHHPLAVAPTASPTRRRATYVIILSCCDHFESSAALYLSPVCLFLT